ncbi:bilirubin reductase, long form [Paratractidigestivibacter sp.]|uniref:bilirubin reductase, long form n=1 Tax=Paratractidigestivibacter sp. TaxID=2847316 RepID=UPI002AC9315A|nr:bilirubin reductase, long form [Paratractidigestivibacter sp.]
MAKPAKLLLEPIKVGPIELKNRIMFPPLTTGYEERDGSIGPRSLAFYERLAKGGVGYIVIGDVAPVMTASPTPRLASDEQIPAFTKLAETLHAHGAKVALQLFHPEYDVPGVGRMVMLSGAAARAAQEAKAAGDMATFEAKMAESSRIRTDAYAKLHHDMQHFVSEASVEQLHQIRDAIAAAAGRASKAGIDAIEVHGDRIVGSLCSVVLNHRTDEYGGSFDNRVRYALEVVAAIKAAAPDLMLEYKLPVVTRNADGMSRGKGGLAPDEACELAKLLEIAGVDMIQVAQANHTGNMGDTIPPMGTVPYNWTLPVAERVKALVGIPIATVGRVVTVEAGEKILAEGKADVIGYGRSLLTDPDIALKAASGEPIRECLNCNKGCVDAIQNRRNVSCVLNAENGDEATMSVKPGEGPKRVAVVGGGIAGLEAARVCALRGYDVTVYEAADKLGGQVNLAAAPPRKSEILRAIEYYEKVLPRLGVKVELGHKAGLEEVNAADAAIVAVGARDFSLPVPGADSEKVVSSWDVLSDAAKVSGRVAVIGGGLVGTETAEYLLRGGCEVTIVEMLDKIAAGESSTILPRIMAEFAEKGVEEHVNTKLVAITDEGVEATCGDDAVRIPCDHVVMAVGSKAVPFDVDGAKVPVTLVGDCTGERTADIASAIRTAYEAANAL